MIGLKRGTVKLKPYNPIWAELFEEEKKLLKGTFGNIIIAVEHIGSTAVPGIPAKPIIDIGIGVRSLDIARQMKNRFEKLGYQHRPLVHDCTTEDLEVQELYVKGAESCRTHYVHVTVYCSDFWNDVLLFRDYLRQNHGRAREYAELKTRLAEEFPDSRGSYTQSKQEFILDTLKLARHANQCI